MSSLQLDFSQYRIRRRRLAGAAALVASCALFLTVLVLQHETGTRIAQLATAGGASRTSAAGRPAALSEAQQRELATALAVQHALNLPWESLLAALEQVSSDGKVQLLALQPNPLKSEVVLAGQADDFEALMAYVKVLRAQPEFAEVALLNQRHVENEEKPSLAFTLAMQWNMTTP